MTTKTYTQYVKSNPSIEATYSSMTKKELLALINNMEASGNSLIDQVTDLTQQVNTLNREVDLLRPIVAEHNQFLTKSVLGRFLFNRMQSKGTLFRSD